VDGSVGKIQASVRRKVDCCGLLDIRRDGSDAVDLLLSGHRWPLLVQLNAHRVLHDDILAADGV